MTCPALDFVPEFDRTGVHLGLHTGAGLERNRVKVRAHLHPSQTVHPRETDFCQIEPFFGQGQQMLALHLHRCPHPQRVTTDLQLLIVLAGRYQLRVQLFQVLRLGNRRPVIPPKIADFSLYSTLFVSRRRGAKLTRIPPVGAERKEPRGLLSPVSP